MGTFYNSQIVTNGLILCLDAGNRKSYPGTGSTWFDLSGTNRNATKAGTQSPTYPQWNSSGFFYFNGGILSENYSRFEVPNIPSFSQLSAFAWYRTGSSEYQTIFRMNNSDFEISLVNNAQMWWAAGTNYDDVYVQSFSSVYGNNNWHNTGLTFDGQILRAYFNGAQIATTTRGTPTTTAAGTLNIGTRDDAYFQHLFGDISSIMIYNRVLSASEILSNYNSMRRRFKV